MVGDSYLPFLEISGMFSNNYKILQFPKLSHYGAEILFVP